MRSPQRRARDGVRLGPGVVVLGLIPFAVGCDRVDDFALAEGEAYCGNITLASNYRQGLSPRVQMRLYFDPTLVGTGANVGSLTTVDAGAEEGEQRLLDEAPLRAIHPLSHDPLSQLEFGDGRDRNFIHAVSPADPDAESLVAIVSLRADDAVEVRLLRPGVALDADGNAPAGREPLFGLFLLTRQAGDCGF